MAWEFDRNLAVAIGIDRYNRNGINNLKIAVGDLFEVAGRDGN